MRICTRFHMHMSMSTGPCMFVCRHPRGPRSVRPGPRPGGPIPPARRSGSGHPRSPPPAPPRHPMKSATLQTEGRMRTCPPTSIGHQEHPETTPPHPTGVRPAARMQRQDRLILGIRLPQPQRHRPNRHHPTRRTQPGTQKTPPPRNQHHHHQTRHPHHTQRPTTHRLRIPMDHQQPTTNNQLPRHRGNNT